MKAFATALAWTLIGLGFAIVMLFVITAPTLIGALIGYIVSWLAPFVMTTIVATVPGLAGLHLWQIGGTIGFLMGCWNVLTQKLSVTTTKTS